MSISGSHSSLNKSICSIIVSQNSGSNVCLNFSMSFRMLMCFAEHDVKIVPSSNPIETVIAIITIILVDLVFCDVNFYGRNITFFSIL